VNAAEIVPANVKGHSGFQVVELLTESVHQPREAAQVYPELRFRPFYMARANVLQVGVAAPWSWDRFNNLGGSVPAGQPIFFVARMLPSPFGCSVGNAFRD